MDRFSLFHLYRYLLTVVACTYVVVRAGGFIWRWQIATDDAERPEALVRRYLVALLLRSRVRRFWIELVQIAILVVVLVLVIRLHD